MSKDYSRYQRRSAVVDKPFDNWEVWHSSPWNGHDFFSISSSCLLILVIHVHAVYCNGVGTEENIVLPTPQFARETLVWRLCVRSSVVVPLVGVQFPVVTLLLLYLDLTVLSHYKVLYMLSYVRDILPSNCAIMFQLSINSDPSLSFFAMAFIW